MRWRNQRTIGFYLKDNFALRFLGVPWVSSVGIAQIGRTVAKEPQRLAFTARLQKTKSWELGGERGKRTDYRGGAVEGFSHP